MVHCQETTGGQGVHREVESEGLAEKELDEGYEWVVDADLKDFFGSVDHDKLLELVNQRVSDGRVLGLLRQMLTAGVVADGKRLLTDQGTPQGGIVSPVLSEPSDKSGKHCFARFIGTFR